MGSVHMKVLIWALVLILSLILFWVLQRKANSRAKRERHHRAGWRLSKFSSPGDPNMHPALRTLPLRGKNPVRKSDCCQNIMDGPQVRPLTRASPALAWRKAGQASSLTHEPAFPAGISSVGAVQELGEGPDGKS